MGISREVNLVKSWINNVGCFLDVCNYAQPFTLNLFTVLVVHSGQPSFSIVLVIVICL